TAALFVTFTRAGYLGVAAGALVFFLLGGSSVVTPARAAVGALVVMAVVALVVLPRIEGTRLFNEGIVHPGTLTARVSYWSLARPLITDSREHLLFGRGVNALPTGNKTAADPLSGGLAATPLLTTIGPHSQYVRILLEQGLLGISLMAVWLLGS